MREWRLIAFLADAPPASAHSAYLWEREGCVARRQGPARGRFYDGVAARADPLVDQWKRETAYEEKP